MKIVVLDGYTLNPGDISWAGLEALGELIVYDRTSAGEMAERIRPAQAVLTTKTRLSRADLDQAPELRYIGVLATGHDAIDGVAARERGVPVTNIPAYATAAVAQFAIGLLLEICLQVGHHARVVAEGRWSTNPDWCFWDYPLLELAGKTMGIIGFGRIGQTTGLIAQALGLKVLACDPYPDKAGRAVAEYVELNRLLAEADIIALHCPLTPETRGLINHRTLSSMKRGVIIINNSRGQLIVEADLAEALRSGQVYAAGLDVVAEEPIRPDNPLLKAENCLITPHMSWTSRESRQRLMDTAEANLRAFLRGDPINVVNP